MDTPLHDMGPEDTIRDARSRTRGTRAVVRGVVHGVVLDARGKPLRDAAVMVETSDAGHPDIATLTDEQGSFTLGGLSPGLCTLRANAAAGGVANATVLVKAVGTPTVVMRIT